MQLMPDWLYSFVPPEWWPDRPREPMFWGISLLPSSGAAAIETLEMVFDKRRDVLVWGGCCLVTDSTQTLIFSPNSGTNSQFLVRLRNPSGAVDYSDGRVISPGNPPNPPGFMPLENLFSVWQFTAKRPVFWPIPIPMPKGASLAMDLIDVNPTNKFLRFTFWTSLMYEERVA